MHDPRKPRPLKPRAITALVVEANPFGHWLAGDILRNLGVTKVSRFRNAADATACLLSQPADVVLVAYEQAGAFDALGYVRSIRRLPDDRVRRLPIILINPTTDRLAVVAGREAGADEFLTRPICPAALLQRLQMVIETPRPFIDSSVHVGPCRRRKDPADYYRARRRAGDPPAERPPARIDPEAVARETPIRRALAQLRQLCSAIPPGHSEALRSALGELKAARALAAEQNDHALQAGLASFEAYIAVAAPLGQANQAVTDEAFEALEQLASLPVNYAEARDNVATALGRAIQQKLAA